MAKLDNRGIIAVAMIGFYVPVAILTLVLLVRYALRRDAGWFFLFIFSLARMANGALLIAAEVLRTHVDLFVAAYIIQAAALSFLMMSTLGFLGMVGHRTFSENPRVIYNLRALGILAIGALVVTVVGGILGTHVAPGKGDTGFILRRVGSGIYGGMYVFLVFIHLGAWTYRWHLKSYRRKLLWGISIGLIPLGARTAYAILASWSSSDLLGAHPSSNPVLARSNPVTGHLALYLVLSPVMEYLVVLIYLYSSVILSRRHH